MTHPDDVKSKDELPAYNIELRMRLLSQWITKGRNDWKQLEEATGIKAVKWRHAQAGVTRPSLEMFEALCKLHPEHAFWLATGIADNEGGHKAPQVNLAFPGGFGTIMPDDSLSTSAYFRQCMSALDTTWKALVQYMNRQRPKRNEAEDKAHVTKDDLVQSFRAGINVSIQLAAGEANIALGKEQQKQLIDRLIGARWDHWQEMTQRLRENAGVDEMIDQGRQREKQLLDDLYKDNTR
ncbi:MULTISPECIES: hypothetical protein [Burkholderia]|uniref:hypothetical protein n=1 Tax=Burkholderia TaxID=32008 RepID=UPI0001A4AD25|nr:MULTISPECIES: hypothetical protein [Burkholderia]ACR27565.1 Hypothetical protein bglu_1g03650 [Burkholderia glumae BGR1]